MHRTLRKGGRRAALTLPVAVLVFLIIGGVGATPNAPPLVHSASATIVINGDWTISSPVSYADASLVVNGGITIAAGGALSLQNVTLSLSEPSDLANGIEVQSQGSLSANGSSFESATNGNQIWMQADRGAALNLHGGEVLDLGDSAGPLGFTVEANDASFNGVIFDQYYEALLIEGASGVTVAHCYFGNSTAQNNGAYAVQTSGSGPGFSLTNSSFVIPQFIGALQVASPSAMVMNNSFDLNPANTNPYPVVLGYAYTGTGETNASGGVFSGNFVTGSDVTDLDSSNVTIRSNKVLDDGGTTYTHDYGIHAYVIWGTDRGWINGLTIEDNLVSDSTGYGIRIEQNITNFVVANNNITNVSTSPTAPSYNDAETFEGIYLIRGVTNGIVEHNYINLSADQENTSISTEGICLESDVDNVTLLDNTILNTDQGIDVQGDWITSGVNIGPSLHNRVIGNLVENTMRIRQTHDVSEAVQNYLWANDTTIANNTIVGWNLVPSGVCACEGAAILQSSVDGTITGNTVNGATYGVWFSFFYGQVVENRSDNVVYDNSFNVTQAAVYDNTGDGMGPIDNVVDALTNMPTSAGTPTNYLQSIGATAGLSFTEGAGAYVSTLETRNPIDGLMENFTTSIPWELPSFGVHISGNLGSGRLKSPIESVGATGTTYAVDSSGRLTHEVNLDVPAEYYSAAYSVFEVLGGSENDTFTLNSSTGPAIFETEVNGTLSVGVGLLGWNATNVTLQLEATNSSGDSVSGLAALVGLDEPQEFYRASVGPTNASGGANFYGLPPGSSVVNVSIVGSSYRLASYSVESPHPDLIQLILHVVPSGTGGDQTTTFPIRFLQSGLGPGVAWWINVSGPESTHITSDGPSLSLNLPNGTYQYVAGANGGYVPVASSSTEFSVLGAGWTIVVAFDHVNSSSSTLPIFDKFLPPLSPATLSWYVIGVVGAVAIWLIGLADFFVRGMSVDILVATQKRTPVLGRPPRRV
jgi:hypothetical protein